jgi:hypothetical protein
LIFCFFIKKITSANRSEKTGCSAKSLIFFAFFEAALWRLAERLFIE